MDSLHSTMNQHIKGKHLSFEERVIIQLRLKDGYSLRAIARELNCSPSTISYEVKRGTVELYHGKVKRYKATQGHDAYQAHRKNCGRKSDFLRKTQFMRYVHKHFFKDGWSLDVCSNRATAVGAFSSRDVVCTKTLYNYVDQGLLDIHNYDLPEKLKRNTKLHRIRRNKKKLGRSIEERPILRIPDKTSVSVMQAFKKLQRQYSEHWNDIFKTITTDNGSEFADLSSLEDVSNTLVYYAHPYTSCDKGTVERHNGLIRRFIPKGEAIDNYSLQDIIDIETWCNSLPRKILAYHTPDEIFERELDLIYQAA